MILKFAKLLTNKTKKKLTKNPELSLTKKSQAEAQVSDFGNLDLILMK